MFAIRCRRALVAAASVGLIVGSAQADQTLAQAAPPTPTPAPEWKFAGDFRLRYELTTEQKPTATPGVFDPRHREVVRFRAGAQRNFGQHLTFGARMTTGAAEDPNSTDVTIGDFADSFEVSLDRAFMEFRSHGITITGGKFANPFATTELVWDGDVHPQGIAFALARSGSTPGWTPKLVGMFFVVDEQSASSDSTMLGVQAQMQYKSKAQWSASLSGGFFDYAIKSLRNADSGDTRSNRLKPGGLALVSDFDLFDVVLAVDHPGLGPKYPVRLAGDLVTNLGAASHDNGFGVDLFVGRASERGDRRFRYGFARAETDAVLAAFSHDNTTLATNYVQHTASAEWQVRKDVQVNLTWYDFRKLSVTAQERNPWVQRWRFNVLMTF